MLSKFKILRQDKLEMIKKINTLELENESLKEDINKNIYKEVIENYKKIEKYDSLLKENKMLRKKIKKLKELINNRTK